MERNEIKAIAENLLLASDQPLTVERFWETFQCRAEKTELREVLQELQKDYETRNLQILEVAEGFQLCTRGEFGEWVKIYLKLDKTAKLSQPALDTLLMCRFFPSINFIVRKQLLPLALITSTSMGKVGQ